MGADAHPEGGADTGAETGTDTGADTGTDSSADAGADTGGGADADAGPGADAGAEAEAGCSGSTPVTLTVKNYLSWCSVSVAGQGASTLGAQTVCVASGTVNLSASAVTGFVLGPHPWHDTSGDVDGGDPGTFADAGANSTSSTTVSVTSGSRCVWACCPSAGVAYDCPTTDQCP